MMFVLVSLHIDVRVVVLKSRVAISSCLKCGGKVLPVSKVLVVGCMVLSAVSTCVGGVMNNGMGVLNNVLV